MGVQQLCVIIEYWKGGIMSVHSMNLFDFGLPNIEVYSNGVIYDLYRNKIIAMPPRKTVTCKSADDSVVKEFRISRLLNMCFCTPWNRCEQYVYLNYLGLSRYCAVSEGYIFSDRIQAPLSPRYTNDGYQVVMLYTDGGDYQPWRVHRLIASAFVPNPENKDTVNHIDGVRDNNHAWNLEWMWMWENRVHARTELHRGPSDETIRNVCKLLEQGYRQMEVARKLGVSRYLVKDIQTGSHYYISKDYNIPRYSNQRRAPIEIRNPEEFGHHGQKQRVHKIEYRDNT